MKVTETILSLTAAVIGLAGLGVTYLVHSVGGSLMQVRPSTTSTFQHEACDNVI